MLNLAVTAAQTTPRFWIILGSFAALSWVGVGWRLRSVTRAGASETTVTRLRRSWYGLLLFVLIAIVRLLTHAY